MLKRLMRRLKVRRLSTKGFASTLNLVERKSKQLQRGELRRLA